MGKETQHKNFQITAFVLSMRIICDWPVGGSVVSICLRTRWTIIAHSSVPLLVTWLSCSKSLSKCFQKYSGKFPGKTREETSWDNASNARSLLQDAQMKDECMIALTIHTAGAERHLSRSGRFGRLSGSPRSWPVLVVSTLHKQGFGHSLWRLLFSSTVLMYMYHSFFYFRLTYFFACLFWASRTYFTPPITAPHSTQFPWTTGFPHYI